MSKSNDAWMLWMSKYDNGLDKAEAELGKNTNPQISFLMLLPNAYI